jgi:valyl-tRNA synthetase
MSKITIDKGYNHIEAEKKWYEMWEKNKYFVAKSKSDKPPFSIVIPPPNITGNLHMGHALVYTLHDVYVRYKRMKGHNTLWLPGVDHAGIATQNVVEKQLASEGTNRKELGREKFEERVWKWKEENEDAIKNQLKKLGCSVDWTRHRFTLDPGLSKAVKKVFVTLYKEGLIYRDTMLVNWCPRCETAVSDLEVKHKDRDGKLWHFMYPVKGEKNKFIRLATTRPETMLGDTAVAVHPDDERYKNLVGKTVILPIVNREIPIIADSFVDKEFGTGAVKVTPAHDPNDFQCAQRNNLPVITVIDKHGKMTAKTKEFAGLDRFEARKAVVAKMEELGLLEKIEKHKHAVGECDRCSTIIEPAISTQWFVKIKPLAEPALKAVENGDIKFVPEKWVKTYYEWMRNIHDWCISRQLWWGHRIPAWHCKDCSHTTVSEETPKTCEKCKSVNIYQETDVLDTWFSSGLWPFSTLGWPDKTEDLQTFYPTSVLLTGFDILFFWVARMIMMGLKFMGDVPFHTVYFNALVRDAQGQKMSKSKGNVINPLEVMEKHGTDALRFTLSIMAVPGTDISLSEKRLEGYRAFCNKIWNATRFVLMNIDENFKVQELNYDNLQLADKWILSKLANLIEKVDADIEKFRFHEAANNLYHFLWSDFCDWYIEASKQRLIKGDEQVKTLLVTVLMRVLKLLHPFMPYITEELYQKLPSKKESIAVEEFPVSRQDWIDESAEKQFELVSETVSKFRNLRAEKNIAPSKKVEAEIIALSQETKNLIEKEKELISYLASLSQLSIVENFDEDKMYVKGAVSGMELGISLENLLDKEAEKTRISKEMKKIEEEMKKLEGKLQNQNFLSRAPKEVVEKNKEKFNKLKGKYEILEQNLNQLN